MSWEKECSDGRGLTSVEVLGLWIRWLMGWMEGRLALTLVHFHSPGFWRLSQFESKQKK